MNIFALDDDPVLAAQALCDQHVGKMLLESAQMLCNAHPEPSDPTQRPQWLIMLPPERAKVGLLPWALRTEFVHRFGKPHGTGLALDWLATRQPGLPASLRTPFVQTMPEQYRGPDAVQAYRRYYAAEKMKLRGCSTWTRRAMPVWLNT